MRWILARTTNVFLPDPMMVSDDFSICICICVCTGVGVGVGVGIWIWMCMCMCICTCIFHIQTRQSPDLCGTTSNV